MKLLIADDHTLFRDTLGQYVRRADKTARLKCVASYDDAYEEVKSGEVYDLVLLDLFMPGMNGMEGLHSLKSEYPELKVALMSGMAEESDVKKAMDLGASAYFPKTMSGKSILSAIQLVLSGERFIPLDHESNDIMPSYFADEKIRSVKSDEDIQAEMENINLTPREKDVLVFLADGASNKEIARALDLQVVTIKLHVRGICQKLEAKNRTQAALRARELGLLSKAS